MDVIQKQVKEFKRKHNFISQIGVDYADIF